MTTASRPASAVRRLLTLMRRRDLEMNLEGMWPRSGPERRRVTDKRGPEFAFSGLAVYFRKMRCCMGRSGSRRGNGVLFCRF
jgi:hypothetical protein